MTQDDGALRALCAELLSDLGVAATEEIGAVRPLTGGVASDIAVVSLRDRDICVKFALPKLRVEAEWKAPVHRNRAEYAWLETARAVVPESVPALFGRSDKLHGFAMEYLEGDGIYLWKDALLMGAAPQGEAEAVATVLGRIHAASAAPGFDRSAFENRDDFHALRIEPYLLHTAGQHRELATPLRRLAEMLYEADAVLVHGDVSPKNILFRDHAPILLDAECATTGDASFDVAFCLNHLVLKAIHFPTARDIRLAEVGRFWEAYATRVDWESADGLEARVAALLPALMLARVDGKSPVEYLSKPNQVRVREIARGLITSPRPRLSDVVLEISDALER